MVNSEQLARLHIGPQWVNGLNETFARFGIDTPVRQACFIAQCSHESGSFRVLEENLNYRAETLLKLFPFDAKKRPWGFTPEKAADYAKQAKRIGNLIYSNRMGNRDEASGDGYRFRGRGCIQLTGHANYYHAGQACGQDFVMEPDLVSTPKYAVMSAGWFWSTHNLNQYADSMDILTMTKRINGGTIGLEDRKLHINQALAVLQS
jgi:putative chitinase